MTSLNRIHLAFSFFVFAFLIPLLFSCAGPALLKSLDPFVFKAGKPTDKSTYVLMKDSSVVYGKNVYYLEGLVARNNVRLDGKPIPFSEVLGFQNKGYYYKKMSEKEFAKIIIKGRITVYEQVVAQGNGMFSITYLQKGDEDPKKYASLDMLKQMVSDCKKAYDMVNIPELEYMKIIRKQPYYTQTVIETYNNCGEWK